MFDVPCGPLALTDKIGNGAFGTVYRSNMHGRVCAIKRVPQNESFCDREIDICRILATGNSPNIVEVLGVFITHGHKRVMHLVMEYLPYSLRDILSCLRRREMRMKKSHLQCYMFQLARALSFIHAQNILHRDMKPENVLVDPATKVLKLADFGSAKQVQPGMKNTTYICSRFYRAPELILDRDLYGPPIDMWSYACILAEIAVGSPFFCGEDSVSQLVAIIRVRGSFAAADTDTMNAVPGNELAAFAFPERAPKPWPRALEVTLNGARVQTSFGSQYEHVLDSILRWQPRSRLTAAQVLAHPFFDDLRRPLAQEGPSAATMPPALFDFTSEEGQVVGVLMPQVLGKGCA